jgi:hypothetical protein
MTQFLLPRSIWKSSLSLREEANAALERFNEILRNAKGVAFKAG